MDTQTHKILDYIEHLLPYVSGLLIAMAAGTKLWWHNNRETKKRISNIETMMDHVVTQSELHACREDVRREDKEILNKIEQLIKENAAQHNEIQRDISDTLKHIGRLHGK